MSQEGELIFWGGEYRDEMKCVHPNRKTKAPVDSPQQKAGTLLMPFAPLKPGNAFNELGPVLEFKLAGGAPRRSK